MSLSWLLDCLRLRAIGWDTRSLARFSLLAHGCRSGLVLLSGSGDSVPRASASHADCMPRARAGMPFQVHAHMLRHRCGYALANAGHDTRAIQDWLGHRSIQHTVRYTEPVPTRMAVKEMSPGAAATRAYFRYAGPKAAKGALAMLKRTLKPHAPSSRGPCRSSGGVPRYRATSYGNAHVAPPAATGARRSAPWLEAPTLAFCHFRPFTPAATHSSRAELDGL